MVCIYKEGEQIFDVIQYISSVIYFFSVISQKCSLQLVNTEFEK